jgi:hypothetical protein
MANNQISYLNFLVEKIIFFGTTIVSAFGIVSNFLNILICLRKNLRNGILGYYNFLISIFNILAFVTISFFYFPVTIGLKSVANLSDSSCAILTYSTRVFIQMSIWINVGVTIDRFLSVTFPNRFQFINDRKKLSFIVLIVFKVLLLLNVPNLFYKINQDVCTSTSLVVFIRNLEIALFRAILPSILHIVFSAILIYKLYISGNRVQSNMNDQRDRRYTRIVIALNVFFCLTEFPFSSLTLYFGIIGQTPSYPISEGASVSIGIANFIYYVTLAFSGFTFNSLFIVNLMFNRKFQKELKKIFCW